MHPHLNIFQHRHGPEQTNVLKSTRNALARNPVRLHIHNRFPIQHNISFIRDIDAGYHVEKGCLSGSIGADYSRDCRIRELKVHPIHRQQAAKLLLKVFNC
ncbi:hypothetical protein D1872_251370 [compost metagenome]